MKRVAVFFADGFEEIEALTVVDVLRRADVPVDMITINGTYLKGAHNILVKADKLIDNVDVSEYAMGVIPGGLPGAENLRKDKRVVDIISKLNAEEKIVAAICAGPIVLEEAKVLDGKRATVYPGFESKLVSAEISGEKVTKDGNVVTGNGPAAALEFAFQLLEDLMGKEVREKIEFGMRAQSKK